MSTIPTVETDDYRIYNGEALWTLNRIPAGSIDCLLTDPPYSSGGAFRSDRTQDTVTKYVLDNNLRSESLHNFSGDNRDQRSYFAWLSLWLVRAFPLMRPGGVVGLFTDWRQLPVTTDALQAGGFIWRGIVPWDKTEAARPAKGRYRNQCEYLVWGSAGPMGSEVGTEGDGVPCLPGLFRVCTANQNKLHIAGKPLELMRGLVRICKQGGVILDPFMGSATTGVAALLEGYRFVGIEIDANHFEISRKRLEKTSSELSQSMFPAIEKTGSLFADVDDSAT